MSLEAINVDWLEIVMFNGAIGANDTVIDVDGPLLAKEALLEASEASRERVAVALKLALLQMISHLKECAWIINKETSEKWPMGMEIIKQVETEVLAAIAQLWPAGEIRSSGKALQDDGQQLSEERSGQVFQAGRRVLFEHREGMWPLMIWRSLMTARQRSVS